MMGPRDVLNGFKFRDCSCNEVGNGSGGGGGGGSYFGGDKILGGGGTFL